MPESVEHEIRTLQTIFWSDRDPAGLAFAPLADALRRKGDLREAMVVLADGLARHPDYATGHVVATRLYMDQGMESEAEDAARRVLELDPENLVALSALASILAARGEADEAARHEKTLLATDPDSDEALALAELAVGVGAVDVSAEVLHGELAPDEADLEPVPPSETETPLQAVAEQAETEPPELEDLIPEAMYQDLDVDALLDGLTVESTAAGDVEGEGDHGDVEEADVSSGAGEEEATPTEAGALPGLEPELPDLDALTVEQSSQADGAESDLASDPLDLASLAPDGSAEEEAVEVADLAPADAGGTIDVADLAPEEEVVEMADLAPEAPEATIDVSDLAPEEVVEMADLAPGAPEATIDVSDLAPEEEVVEIADLAPAESAPTMDAAETPQTIDLADLAPAETEDVDEVGAADETEPEDADRMEDADDMEDADETEVEDDASTEPVYTRTLADLYTEQGFPEKALQVLQRIREREPDAADLEERIDALRKKLARTTGAPAPGGAPPEPLAEGPAEQSEDDVERRARELAERTDHHGDELDTPFAWSEPGEEATDDDDEDIASYLSGLLAWERQEKS